MEKAEFTYEEKMAWRNQAMFERARHTKREFVPGDRVRGIASGLLATVLPQKVTNPDDPTAEMIEVGVTLEEGPRGHESLGYEMVRVRYDDEPWSRHMMAIHFERLGGEDVRTDERR